MNDRYDFVVNSERTEMRHTVEQHIVRVTKHIAKYLGNQKRNEKQKIIPNENVMNGR